MLKPIVTLLTIGSFLVAAYLGSTAEEGILPYIHLPAQFRNGYRRRWAIVHYAFDPSVPRNLQRRLLLGTAFMMPTFLGFAVLALRSHAPQGALFALFGFCAGGAGLVKNWGKFRRTGREIGNKN